MLADCGHAHAQEGVAGLLDRQRRGQGRQALLAQAGGFPGALLQGGIVRLHGQGEAQVAQGVLVGAVHAGLRRQAGQALQRGVHLLGGAFEQAAATGGEQGVAAEQQGLVAVATEQGDMPGGMPGHVQHLPLAVEHAQALVVLEGDIAPGNLLQGRAEHPCAGLRFERRNAAGVVVVVVGDQDVAELPARMGG
ncbi:hypothetical protein D3C78_1218160 [compost metagenome]